MLSSESLHPSLGFYAGGEIFMCIRGLEKCRT